MLTSKNGQSCSEQVETSVQKIGGKEDSTFKEIKVAEFKQNEN